MESKLLASRHGIECQSSGLFFLGMKYDLQCWEVLSLPDIQRTKKAQVLGSIGQILTQSFFKDLFIMQFAAACLTHTQWVIDFLFKVSYEQTCVVDRFSDWNYDFEILTCRKCMIPLPLIKLAVWQSGRVELLRTKISSVFSHIEALLVSFSFYGM